MKKWVTLLLCLMLVLPAATALAEEVEGSIVLPAAKASFSKDKGVTPENKKAAAKYDKETGFIWNLATDAKISYTVPDGVEGVFDVYLTVSRTLADFGSQPFCFSIAGGEMFSVPVDCRTPSAEEEDIADRGRFLIQHSVTLKAGDTIEILCAFGAKSPKLKGAFFPGVGDVLLAPAGTPVGVGYDLVLPEQEAIDPADALSGKTILWLGSSVTYGASAEGHYSMVDAVEDLHPALTCEKYAINATTLVNQSTSSYVARLKMIPKDKPADLVVVQLSTNDATTNKPFGEVGESFDLSDFDETTIAGAIETIIAYSRDTFGCPVVFYTGTYCEKENYAEMVELLKQIQKKWGIGVIDMFNAPDMTAVFGTEQYDAWMADQVHPNRDGYVEWWTPVIDAYLVTFMAEQN